MKILVTGARAPAAVDLVRWLARQGHQVDVADTIIFATARASSFARHYLRYPSPRHQPEGFAKWFAQVQHSYDVIWPSCEEVFALSRLNHPRVFSPPFHLLVQMHDKGEFSAWLERADLGLKSPTTKVIWTSPLRQVQVPAGFVGKPAFSRFGHRTLFGPTKISPSTADVKWLLQERVYGHEACSYTIAHQGEIVEHVVYSDPTRSEGEPCLVFRKETIGEIDEFCRSFCARTRWEGQIAFDFRKDRRGQWKVLEANPRLTSGIHLVAYREPSPHLASARFLKRPRDCLREDFWISNDVLFRQEDPCPAFQSILCLLELQVRFGRPVVEAATADIAYP